MSDEAQVRHVEEAFARGVEMLGTDKMFLQLAANAVKMVGRDLVNALEPDEHAAIGAPAQVVHDGGDIDMGAVLVTDRRALVAWFHGVRRPVTTVRTCELSGIGAVTEFRRKGMGRLSSERDAVAFEMPSGAVQLVLYAAEDTNSRQQFLLSGFLNGSVTAEWEGSEDGAETDRRPRDGGEPAGPANAVESGGTGRSAEPAEAAEIAADREEVATEAVSADAVDLPVEATEDADHSQAASGHRVLPPPVQPTVLRPSTGGGPPGGGDAQVRVGSSEFTWPLPDREVEVAGRQLSAEVLAVASLYGVAGLWLLWKVRDIFGVASLLPSLFSSSAFEFVFAWVIFMAAAMVFYVVLGLLYTAYLLIRADPVGRGLATALFAVTTLLLFTPMRSGPVVFAFLVTGACSAVLHLSPWARRTFSAAPSRHGRPSSVVLAQTLAVSYFSLLAIAMLMVLPGLRFVGEAGLGAKFVVLVLFCVSACVIALLGASQLRRAPSRQARLMVTSGVVQLLIGQLVVWVGASFVVALVIGATIVSALWLAPSAREWFGDPPARRSDWQQ